MHRHLCSQFNWKEIYHDQNSRTTNLNDNQNSRTLEIYKNEARYILHMKNTIKLQIEKLWYAKALIWWSSIGRRKTSLGFQSPHEKEMYAVDTNLTHSGHAQHASWDDASDGLSSALELSNLLIFFDDSSLPEWLCLYASRSTVSSPFRFFLIFCFDHCSSQVSCLVYWFWQVPVPAEHIARKFESFCISRIG